jgi:hypothetical protein
MPSHLRDTDNGFLLLKLFPKEGEKQNKIRHCCRMIAESVQKDYGINGCLPKGSPPIIPFPFCG